MPAALADKHGDTNSLVAVLFDRFHPAAPDVNREARVLGHIHRSVARAQFARATQHRLCHLAKPLLIVIEHRGPL